MQVEGELDPLPYLTMELIKHLIATDYEWSASTGLLSRLNEHTARALSYVFLSALHCIQPTGNVSQSNSNNSANINLTSHVQARTYFPERFVDSSNPWASISLDAGAIEALRKHEQRVVKLTYSVVERLLVIKETSQR